MTKTDLATNEVALVLDPNFGEQVLPLARRMPLWIVSSASNDIAVKQARHEHIEEGRITQLLLRAGETPQDLLARAVCSIDEHHGEASQVVAYDTLWVYGAEPQMMSPELMSEIGFKSIVATRDGFSLHRL